MKLYNILLTSALGLLIAYVIFRFVRNQSKGELAIKQVFSKSAYSELSPFIIAQAKHESNNFKSPLYLRSNNMFGMTNASERNQLGKEVANDQYRHYKSDVESAKDLLLYFEYFNFPQKTPNLVGYVNQLKDNGYFTSSYDNYYNGLARYV